MQLRDDVRACGLNGCNGKPIFTGPDAQERMLRHVEREHPEVRLA